MIRKALYKVTGLLPCRLISRDGTPYLERYFVCRVLGLTVYLHRFVGCDGDNEVHNHPWNSIAVCLVGGYLEERVTGICILQGWRNVNRRIFPGRVNRIRANDFHRIKSTKPETWTLFIHGRTRLGWGFLHRNLAARSTKDSMVIFHQPFPLTSGAAWWLDAPTGNNSGRETLPTKRGN